MTGAISGTYSYYGAYNAYMANRQANAAQALQGGQRAAVLAVRRSASPETPVEPVRPAAAVNERETPAVRLGPVIREGADPAEMAVRMRIKPCEDPSASNARKSGDAGENGGELKVGAEGAQAAVEEGKCQTCEKRKYQDESDDMGVSFQTPTNISPEQAASAVRGHENEHVVRDQAKARQEGRKVVSQSVTIHTDICPECGKVYVSGGTTRTVTAASSRQDQAEDAENASRQADQASFSVLG